MQVEQLKWNGETTASTSTNNASLGPKAQLVFLFGSRLILQNPQIYSYIKSLYPNAFILSGTTAGEICGTEVGEDSLVATAVYFEHTQLKAHQTKLTSSDESFNAGKRLGQTLDKNNLSHVFVLSDGTNVNGTDLVKGLTSELPANITITGGLAGDGEKFTKTLVSVTGTPDEKQVAVIGFYGNKLKIGAGSMGGWMIFGPERKITKSKGNVLFELDGENALKIYKEYLGDLASNLPLSGLLYPLGIKLDNGEILVRTLLAIDEQAKSMTYAGDIPEGAKTYFMRANTEQLISGAKTAAEKCQKMTGNISPSFAVLVSCVGRKLVMKQRIEEELEAVQEVLGDKTVLTGFYSYGEICPSVSKGFSELHNQTMTITTFSEQ